MIEVLSISPGRVTISTKGLFRIHIPATGETIDELCDARESLAIVELFNGMWATKRAVATSYVELAKAL